MQETNLSSKIIPSLREDWQVFIEKVQNDYKKLINQLTRDKQRIRDLERVINKINEITNASKDNVTNILKYRDLFMYVDKKLASSFDALEFFQKQDNLDNVAVKAIYNRIINSLEIIKLTSEYNSLTIKVEFNKERIKKLSGLINGNKIDYPLINELMHKYNFDENRKKSILLYPVIMLSTKAREDKKLPSNQKDIFKERFKELCQEYYHKKEEFNDLLVNSFYMKEKMSVQELDTYTSFIKKLDDMNKYELNDEEKYKVYILSFFKLKKNIEKVIDGISDLLEDEDVEDDLLCLEELINDFSETGNIIKAFTHNKKEDVIDNKGVYYALDAFNRLIIGKDILEINGSVYENILESNIRPYHMPGVSDLETVIKKSIMVFNANDVNTVFIQVNNSILIIYASKVSSDNFERNVRQIMARNIVPIKKQIELIINNDIDYIELEKEVLGDNRKTK